MAREGLAVAPALAGGEDRARDDYLIKPFSARELRARVNAHLELARRRKAVEEELRRGRETLERQVRERTAELEEADRAKDQFLAALSHELRTPLAPVRLALFSLEHEEGLSAAGREAVAMIGRKLELECRLIDDLLDVSRIVHGKLEVRLAPVDLHGCVRAALAAKGVRLTVALEATNATVRGERARLEQVFCNLLQNAAKFTPPGGAVSVRSRNLEGGSVAVEVADTGVGIAPGLLPKMFDPFEQGGAEVARRHGGQLRENGCSGDRRTVNPA